jgi:transcriptional regulator with PAS, ATPase and Fis domain
VSHTTETEARRTRRKERDDYVVLTVVHHPDPALLGVHQAVPPGEHAVGRDGGSLLPGVFEHKKVSREHAAFRLERGRLSVRDLNSRNGTHVNGREVDDATLASGDVVRIGGIVLLRHTGPRHFAEPDDELMAGTSHLLARLLEELREAGQTGHNVMLIGETGVGKELAAEALHAASGRRGALVPVNCGGIAEGVLHSELFGHAKGAFSGADTARDGLVHAAEGGTLFLDEVGAASPSLQSTLLRLIESNEYRVVGTNQCRSADVRFVAATQPDIESRMQAGAFRRDLWYRLAHRIVRVPPLRERRQDIPAIIARHTEQHHGRRLRLSAELAALLVHHHWPGNVRELIATVDQLAATARSDEEVFIPDWLRRELERSTSEGKSATDGEKKGPTKRPKKPELVRLLVENEASVAATAKALSVDRKSLYRWMKALDIDLDALRARFD